MKFNIRIIIHIEGKRYTGITSNSSPERDWKLGQKA
jgi:hypothetical protein